MSKKKLSNFNLNNLKIALIVTTGRTGSDYLNCCLDNLEGIMTFCGKFNYHQFFKDKDYKVDKKILINRFVKKYKHLFSYNKEEDINTRINLKKFKNNFIKFSHYSKINRKNFLIALYKAYHFTLGRNFHNIKFLVHHSHGINETNKVLEDFPNAKLLVTIRNPLANLKSGLSNWFKYDKKKISMHHVFTYIYRIRQDMQYLQKIKNKKIFIKLEEANLLKVKKKICKFLSIKIQKNIFKATLAGKVWRGDRLSINKSKKGEYIKTTPNNNWKNYFSHDDILLLSLFYKDYKKFGYKLYSLKFNEKIKCYLSIFNLFSFEKYVFKYNNNLINFNNIKYFIFRILYFLLIFLKLDFVIKNKHLS
tara:strand:- start:145 stop:1233 length:1089 start_codon:yes stop_codon:yes gene_type:complete